MWFRRIYTLFVVYKYFSMLTPNPSYEVSWQVLIWKYSCVEIEINVCWNSNSILIICIRAWAPIVITLVKYHGRTVQEKVVERTEFWKMFVVLGIESRALSLEPCCQFFYVYIVLGWSLPNFASNIWSSCLFLLVAGITEVMFWGEREREKDRKRRSWRRRRRRGRQRYRDRGRKYQV